MNKSLNLERPGMKGFSVPEERMEEPPRRGTPGHWFSEPSSRSFRTGVVTVSVLSVMAAYSFLWGEHSGIVFAGIFLLVLAVAALIVPIEWLFVMNAVAFILADSLFDLSALNYYYTRFVPLAMFAVRSLLPSTLQKVRTHMLPGFFLKPFGLFFLMALVSATYDKLDPGSTVLRAITMGFLLVAFGVGLPVYAANDRRLRRIFHGIVAVLAFSIAVGYAAIPFSQKTLFEIGDYVRFRGIYFHPNTLGLMAMLVFFPALAWRQENPKGKRWPLTIVLFMALMAVLASGSRASLAGLVAGAVVFVGFRRSDWRNRVLLTVLCILGFSLLIGLPQVYPGMLRTDSGWRLELWERALHLGGESPLLGSGFGSTNKVFRDDRPNLIRDRIYAGGSHNEYARIFVGMGALGLFLALLGFAMVIVRAVRVIRIERNPVLPVCLLAAVVSGLTNALFEDWLFAFGGAPAFPFWFFLVSLALYCHRHTLLRKAYLRRYLARLDFHVDRQAKSPLNQRQTRLR